MNRKLAKKGILFFLLTPLVVLASVERVLAEEIGPTVEPGLVVREGIVLIRPDESTSSLDMLNSEPAFLPPDNDTGLMSWTTVLSENFDGDFPSAGWTLINRHPTEDLYWGATTYRSHSWDRSAHPGGLGFDHYNPRASYYQNNMESWITYGPLDLSTAVDARFEFEMWLDTEVDTDRLFVCASGDGSMYICIDYSGTTDGWHFISLSISDWVYFEGALIGDSSVWIGFVFVSNETVTRPGVFIDSIVVRKTASSPEPDLKMLRYYPEPDVYHPGDSIATTTEFINLGLSPCENYTFTQYLSADQTITTGDIEIFSMDINIPYIQPDEYKTLFTPTPTIPSPFASGMYYLGVIVDCSGDTETSNNTAYYPNPIEITVAGVGGVIFQDNFEGEDLSFWTRYNPGKTGLSACAAGAISGDKGACFYRPSGNDKRRQLIDETPVNQTDFSTKFKFDINGLSMQAGERFRFMQTKMGADRPFFVVLKYQGGEYWIQLNVLLDDRTKVKTGWHLLTDAPHTIEAAWSASSVAGADTGTAWLFIDGDLMELLQDLDTDTIYVETFKIGYTSRMGGKSISGVFYVDEVSTKNGGLIGLP